MLKIAQFRYKYEDDLHNLESFTTDENGSYSYTQDISTHHLVSIMLRPSTIFLSDTGWSDPSVGTWDSITRTGTLTTNVSETIQIDSDNITLDGNGYTITAPGITNYGLLLSGRNGVTVKNLTIQNFNYGIYLYDSSNITLTSNSVNSNTRHGIYISSSTGNTLKGNTMSGNKYHLCVSGWSLYAAYDHDIDTSNLVDGKPIYYIKNAVDQTFDSSTDAGTFYCINCNNVTIKDLILTNNHAGVFLWNTTNSTIENVSASNGCYGIYVLDSSKNTLINNNTNLNYSSGIHLFSSTVGSYPNTLTENTLINNTANENRNGGIVQMFCDGNTFINNNTNSNGAPYCGGCGISLFHSSYNTLTGNTANSNGSGGINLFWMVNDNTFTDNTVSMNQVGIQWHSLKTFLKKTNFLKSIISSTYILKKHEKVSKLA